MSSIISASTTSATALNLTADTSGQLEIKTGSTPTTAITVDTSQRAAFVAGTAALPAITTTGDTNTGIFFPAADAIAFGNDGTERMRIASNSEIYIGSTTPFGNGGKVQIDASTGGYTSNALNLKSISAAYPLVCWNNGGSNLVYFTTTGSGSVGTISTNGTSTSYNTTSDYRLKENIAPMTGALARVSQLKPVTYKWKVDGSDGQGFIAHELQAIVPDCVTGEKDAIETYTDEEGNEQTRIKPQGVDTSFLVATLTAAIQEQQTIINDLKARIETLEAK